MKCMTVEDFAEHIKAALQLLDRDTRRGTRWVHFQDLYSALRMNGVYMSIATFKIHMLQLHEHDFRKYETSRGAASDKNNAKYGFTDKHGLHCYMRIHTDEEMQE